MLVKEKENELQVIASFFFKKNLLTYFNQVLYSNVFFSNLQGAPYISGHHISSHRDYKWLNLTTKFDMLWVLGVAYLHKKNCGSILKNVDFFLMSNFC